MKRNIAAGLVVVAAAAGVGWNLGSHSESSTGLQDISLVQHSERSDPGTTASQARIRLRLSPNDIGYEIRATAAQVPQVALAAE
jgi:hypothetical protein